MAQGIGHFKSIARKVATGFQRINNAGPSSGTAQEPRALNLLPSQFKAMDFMESLVVTIHKRQHSWQTEGRPDNLLRVQQMRQGLQ
jgi:hypothetical protein